MSNVLNYRYAARIGQLIWMSTLLSCPASTIADMAAGWEAHDRGDYAAACAQWLPLADDGDAVAQFYLGKLYYNGLGVPEDKGMAFHYFEMAVGSADTQYNLGVAYWFGEDVPEDRRQAVYWFRGAAEQGLANAQHDLGLAYLLGEGVPEDRVRAFAWLGLAAAQGHPHAESKSENLRRIMTPDQIAEGQLLGQHLSSRINAEEPAPAD